MQLEELLGIDPRDPLARRAKALVESDKELMRKLVKIRDSKGLTQSQVAERMDISQSAVARIEQGQRDPRLSTLRRYAMAVGVVITHDVDDDEGLGNIRTPEGQLGAHAKADAWPEFSTATITRRRTQNA